MHRKFEWSLRREDQIKYNQISRICLLLLWNPLKTFGSSQTEWNGLIRGTMFRPLSCCWWRIVGHISWRPIKSHQTSIKHQPFYDPHPRYFSAWPARLTKGFPDGRDLGEAEMDVWWTMSVKIQVLECESAKFCEQQSINHTTCLGPWLTCDLKS